jgi:hypothetical protein
MWGAALFFITIVLVTPGGRAAAGEYLQQTLSLFSGQLPYSEVALALMALSALGCMLTMLGHTRQKHTERWIWWEIRQESGASHGR